MDTKLLIESFYTSFQRKDWRGMQECYHPQVRFSDPVFQNLEGARARAMWHMLVLAGKDLVVSFHHVKSDGQYGSCQWEARYSFSRTGRSVHNIIMANLLVQEGKIIQHKDSFNLWRWSRMALGLPGVALGWSGLMQNKVRTMAQKNLDKFIQEHPEYRAM